MERPVYDHHLTTIHACHAAPLTQLRDLAATSVFNLSTAVVEEIMQAALSILEAVAQIVDDMFLNGEISDSDLPFGEVRMDTEGLQLSHSTRSSSSEKDSDDDVDDASWSSAPSIPLMDLASACSTTTFTDLRRLYSLYYSIHVYRIDRLLLRLNIPGPLSTSTNPSRPEPTCQTPLSSSAAGINHAPIYERQQHTQTEEHRNNGGAGVPLTEDKAIRYAHVFADELLQVAEYKRAIAEVLVREAAGGSGAV